MSLAEGILSGSEPYLRENVNYLYDGSFEGMLCCIFEAFARKERPGAILTGEAQQTSLFEERWVESLSMRANRVYNGLMRKISPAAARLVRILYLSEHPEKELVALDFVRLAFRVGPGVTAMRGDPVASTASAAVERALAEAHKYKGLLRFSDVGGVLVAEIEPKNRVLPLFAAHFCGRYRNEEFLIYDRTHKEALIWQSGEARFEPIDTLALPPVTGEEKETRRLWQRFYRTIAIAARENPRCRQTNMAKRYWNLLTELQPEDLQEAARPAAR